MKQIHLHLEQSYSFMYPVRLKNRKIAKNAKFSSKIAKTPHFHLRFFSNGEIGVICGKEIEEKNTLPRHTC